MQLGWEHWASASTEKEGEMKAVRSWLAVGLVAAFAGAGCAVSPPLSADPSKGPRITALQVPTNRVTPGSVLNLHVTAQSPDDSKLTYQWEATAGTLSDGSIPSPVWRAPASTFGQVGMVTITARVIDEKGRQASQQAQVTIDNTP